MDAAACLIWFEDFATDRALQRTDAREQLKNSSVRLICSVFNMHDFHLIVYFQDTVNRMYETSKHDGM